MKTLHYLSNHKKIAILLLCIPVILICCKTQSSTTKTAATIKPALTPDSADIAIAHAHWAGATFANLTQGYAIFSDKCTQCHEVKNPQDYSITDWNNILPEMSKKANLDSVQYRYVYQYILAKREEILSGKK